MCYDYTYRDRVSQDYKAMKGRFEQPIIAETGDNQRVKTVNSTICVLLGENQKTYFQIICGLN
jgi:hypothetical protein